VNQSLPFQNVLFGESSTLNARRTYEKVQDDQDDEITVATHVVLRLHRDSRFLWTMLKKKRFGGLGRYFVSFHGEHNEYLEPSECGTLLTHFIDSGNCCSSPAMATMSDDLFDGSNTNFQDGSAPAFAPRAAAATVLGTSIVAFQQLLSITGR
jgi:hypothetical protein